MCSGAEMLQLACWPLRFIILESRSPTGKKNNNLAPQNGKERQITTAELHGYISTSTRRHASIAGSIFIIDLSLVR
jgi:hypothetical protein